LGGPPKRKDMVMVFYGEGLTELCSRISVKRLAIVNNVWIRKRAIVLLCKMLSLVMNSSSN
jgi:hypothetical protein